MVDYIKLESFDKVAPHWTDSKKFDAFGKFVDKKNNYVSADFPGIKYQICIKKERDFRIMERIFRAVKGVIFSILTLGFCNFSKKYRELFTKEKKVLRFAVKVIESDPKLMIGKTPEELEVIKKNFRRL